MQDRGEFLVSKLDAYSPTRSSEMDVVDDIFMLMRRLS